MPIIRVSLAICLLLVTEKTIAFTANKVWFEFLPSGAYKISINYTVPELKEFRESYVIFYEKDAAEDFYWALVRGADFHPSKPYQLSYPRPQLQPDPW